jgi:hypothetical protein
MLVKHYTPRKGVPEMAEDTTSTPKRGKKLKAELEAELAVIQRKEASRKEANRVFLRYVAPAFGVVIIMVLIAGFAAFNGYDNTAPKSVAIAGGEVIPAVSQETTELVPFVKGGTPSYTSFEAEANRRWKAGSRGMWLALTGLHGFNSVRDAQVAVRQHVEKEAVYGLNYYVRVVGADGLWVTNTGLGTNGYRTLVTRLNPGDTYLVWDSKLASVPAGRRGKEAVRRGCGNAITRHAPEGGDESGKSARNPYGSPKKPGNPVYRNPRATRTPGYAAGNAEHVTRDQNSRPRGGTAPTPHGTPGSNSGSNSAGEHADPPSGDPDPGLGGETSSGETGEVN